MMEKLRKEDGRMNDWRADTRKIRRQPQEKFKVDESCNVLEPNSLPRIPIVENIENGDGFPESERNARAAALPPPRLARRICAFSNEISLTGEVLPVPDCRVRSDGAGCRKWDTKNTNPFRLFTYPVSIHPRRSSRRSVPVLDLSRIDPFPTTHFSCTRHSFRGKGVRFESIAVVSFVFIDFRAT